MIKNTFLYILCFVGVIVFPSCEEYLTPSLNDQMTLEEAFDKRITTERYLSQVYSFLPKDYEAKESTTPRSDEAYYSWIAWAPYLGHNDGSWNPSTNLYHTWSYNYKGIHQASIFIENVDKCLELSAEERLNMKAEARFIRAYLYFMMVEQYGPVYIWGDRVPDLNIKNEEIDRHSLEFCFEFINSELEKAATDLPLRIQDPAWYGRATKGAALATRARMLLYAARPLFNGCDLYKGMQNYYGDFLFPQAPDPVKWEKAAKAAKDVIDLGIYKLYENTTENDPLQRGIKSYMGIYFEKWNDELIFAKWESDGWLWNVRCNPPLVVKHGYGGYAPSMKLVDTYPMAETGRFPVVGYQSNGTPNIDPLSGYSDEGFVDSYVHPIDKFTIKAHQSCVGRDARFYASVLFNGMYWINTFQGKKLVTFYTGGTSTYNNKSGDFSKVGYLWRRMTDPRNDMDNNKWGSFSWPYIRLAEVYLNYAEACNEKPTRDETSALNYLNKVRNRSGLNNIEEAYPEVKGNQGLLRELIRKERLVEMAFENLRYYDIRTWMIADKESNGPRYGRNLLATNYEDSWERTDQICLPLVFQPKHYLFPIHQSQLDEMKNITQNYGW